MKIIRTLLPILAILLSLDSAADPGTPDTLRVDSISVRPGSGIILPVYFYNDEPLSALEFVLTFDGDFLAVDSFSLTGGRVDYLDTNNIISRDSTGLFHLNLIDWFGWIPRGNGLLCNLYFTVEQEASGQSFLIDTTHWGFAKTFFADSIAGPIYPIFSEGYIDVQDPPPSYDSIWVENVTGAPGQIVNVNVYGYNETPLDTLHLALEYSSSSVKFINAIFAGTRGDSAQSRIFSANNELRQALITMVYSPEMPLTPGTGILATLQFEIDSGAVTEIVLIDSASYLGLQPLQFCMTDDFGGECIAPLFTPGELSISTATPVEDNKSNILPASFALKQNYPNPFNPTTTIAFDLPYASQVSLKIYNIMGQKVKTLINRPMTAGNHQVTFNGRNDNNRILASGVYFYRIVAEDYHQSRKMTLMK